MEQTTNSLPEFWYTVPHVLDEFCSNGNTPLGKSHIEIRVLRLHCSRTVVERRTQETGGIRRDVTKQAYLLTHHSRPQVWPPGLV